MNSYATRVIGLRLKEALDQAGIATEEAALKCGMSRASLYRYFNLERDPKADLVAEIQLMTGADAGWLLTGQPPSKRRSDDYSSLFYAFGEAKRAYLAIEATRLNWSDIQGDLRKDIWDAGQRLNSLGGVAAMSGALQAMFPNDPDRTLAAGSQLNHLWSGIGDWLA